MKFRKRIQKFFFACITVVICLAGVEGVMRLTGIGDPLDAPDPFTGFRKSQPLFQPVLDEYGVTYYETSTGKRSQEFFPSRFSAVKPGNTFRTFALGGSTVWGDGAGGRYSAFPFFLNETLKTLHPDTDFEMINAAAKGYASYRIRLLLEEIVNYDPDLVLIYTGHNEFLEFRFKKHRDSAREWVERTKIFLHHSNIYTWLWAGLLKFKPDTRTSHDSIRQVLGEGIEQSPDLYFNPNVLEEMEPVTEAETLRIKERFKWNLSKIITLCKTRNIPLMMGVPACRLWMRPHVSLPSVWEDEHYNRVKALAKEGVKHLRKEHFKALGKIADRGIKLDPEYADFYFFRACVRFNKDDREGTLSDLIVARDLDQRGHRQKSEFRRLMIEILEENEVPYFDAQAFVNSSKGYGPFGRELFLDHVHFTRNTHKMIAAEVLELLQHEGIIPSE